MSGWLKDATLLLPGGRAGGAPEKRVLLDAIDAVSKESAPQDGLFPRVNRYEREGKEYYLRLYWLRYIHTAACYIWAVRKGEELGLNAPPIKSVSFTRVHGRSCICVLEEALSGDFVRKWDREIGADLGDGMAVWNSIESVPWFVRRDIGGGWSRRFYGRLLSNRPALGVEYTRPQRDLIRKALKWLGDEEFLGRVGVSHGDLHNGNLLRLEGDRVGWLDLDAVRYQPIRHDLAAAEMGLMFRNPSVINAFEEKYFGRLPGEWKGWRKHRRKWFIFFNLLRAIKYLTGNPRLPGQKDRTADERRRHAEKHFIFAETASDIPGTGISSAELVRQIVLKSGVYDDELEDNF